MSLNEPAKWPVVRRVGRIDHDRRSCCSLVEPGRWQALPGFQMPWNCVDGQVSTLKHHLVKCDLTLYPFEIVPSELSELNVVGIELAPVADSFGSIEKSSDELAGLTVISSFCLPLW